MYVIKFYKIYRKKYNLLHIVRIKGGVFFIVGQNCCVISAAFLITPVSNKLFLFSCRFYEITYIFLLDISFISFFLIYFYHFLLLLLFSIFNSFLILLSSFRSLFHIIFTFVSSFIFCKVSFPISFIIFHLSYFPILLPSLK